MKMVVYAVITLFYAVPEASAKYCDSRNGLLFRELHGIIRRSQPATWRFTLLITLLFASKARLVGHACRPAYLIPVRLVKGRDRPGVILKAFA